MLKLVKLQRLVTISLQITKFANFVLINLYMRENAPHLGRKWCIFLCLDLCLYAFNSTIRRRMKQGRATDVSVRP
jgi:hypothetical protein